MVVKFTILVPYFMKCFGFITLRQPVFSGSFSVRKTDTVKYGKVMIFFKVGAGAGKVQIHIHYLYRCKLWNSRYLSVMWLYFDKSGLGGKCKKYTTLNLGSVYGHDDQIISMIESNRIIQF